MNGDEGGTKLMELSYDSGGKWKLFCGEETTKEHSSTWERGKPHQVAIVLQNGNQSSAYVDGRRVGGDEPCVLGNKNDKGISYFYIGGDGDSTGSQDEFPVTVTNVFLYNRPLTFPGGNADLEKVTDSPPETPQPIETVTESVEEDKKTAPPATTSSEAPGVQATLQQ
ncbi:trans-sialidase, putative, partial [Trypanosoma cruzi marinkellei]